MAFFCHCYKQVAVVGWTTDHVAIGTFGDGRTVAAEIGDGSA
jgi:hypothetical protein